MTDPVDECQKLKREEAKESREGAEAQGALGEILRELNEEFGVASVEDAKKLLVKIMKLGEAKEEEYQEVLLEYHKIREGRKLWM